MMAAIIREDQLIYYFLCYLTSDLPESSHWSCCFILKLLFLPWSSFFVYFLVFLPNPLMSYYFLPIFTMFSFAERIHYVRNQFSSKFHYGHIVKKKKKRKKKPTIIFRWWAVYGGQDLDCCCIIDVGRSTCGRPTDLLGTGGDGASTVNLNFQCTVAV